MYRFRELIYRILLLALLAGVTGCETLRYRDVQHDFERAVRADIEGSKFPFVDWYENVVYELEPDAIAGLDPRLRPNAWMLRSVAAWRGGQLALARESAKAGRKDPNLRPHSRDDVILHMIDALVLDSETFDRFRQAGPIVNPTDYESFAKDFETALTLLDEARERIQEPTPLSVRHYWRYQRWRLLQNWSQTIAAIDPDEAEFMVRANEEATAFLGADLSSAAAAARDAIPSDHPLHRSIQASEGKD